MVFPMPPINIHGLYLPLLKRTFSMMKPMMGSFSPSQIRQITKMMLMTTIWAEYWPLASQDEE